MSINKTHTKMLITNSILKELAREAKNAFDKGIDFSDKSKLKKITGQIYGKLDRFKIGPRVLCLLLVFAFKEEKRRRLWEKVEKTIRQETS